MVFSRKFSRGGYAEEQDGEGGSWDNVEGNEYTGGEYATVMSYACLYRAMQKKPSICSIIDHNRK